MMNRSLPASLFFALLLAVAGLVATGPARAQSGADGPFESSADLYDYWDAQFGGHGMHIELEGQTIYSRYGFGPAVGAAYVYCPSRGALMSQCSP